MTPRKTWLLLLLLFLAIGFGVYKTMGTKPEIGKITEAPAETAVAATSAVEKADAGSDIKEKLDSLLQDNIDSPRTLSLPAAKGSGLVATRPDPFAATPALADPAAEGRQKRKSLPMGILLWDDVPVWTDSSSRKLLTKMRTGDIVRIYPDYDNPLLLHIHPGVDAFLGATTQNIEPAGIQYPDKDGWAERKKIQILSADQAIEFTQTADPMTLGDSSNFSTLEFYERALKNPDPVVHRIIGPRLIEIVSLHEEYVTYWTTLYRDPDSKIRSYTLAQLKKRGIGRSRQMIEDLILRLSELTRKRAEGETEIEVITLIEILKDTHSPRVAAAFDSFREAWTGIQSAQIMESLN